MEDVVSEILYCSYTSLVDADGNLTTDSDIGFDEIKNNLAETFQLSSDVVDNIHKEILKKEVT